MRFITDVLQVYRLAGIENEVPLHFLADDTIFPPYEYTPKIPIEVGRELIENFKGVQLHPGRDFLNDDGGYAVILDTKADLEHRCFGMPSLLQAEGVKFIKTESDERWAIVLFIVNNETGIDYVFNTELLDADRLKQLLDLQEEE